MNRSRVKSQDPKEPRHGPRISRRDFLKVARGAGAVATTVGAWAIPFRESKAYARGRFHYEADVVVVGSGAAALAAAPSRPLKATSSISPGPLGPGWRT